MMLQQVLCTVFFIWQAYGSILPGLRGEPADGSTFRLDYQYYPKADGWLKVHRIPALWKDARRTCLYEGAYLASPSNEELAIVMRALAQEKHLPTIHTGIHTISSVQDYISIEGVPLRKMHLKWEFGEPNNFNNSERCLSMSPEGLMADVPCYSEDVRPYICYKPKVGFTSMNECGYHVQDYVVDPDSGRCYKFHGQAQDWIRALDICNAEGGTLAIINSEAEARFFAKLVAQNNYKSFVHLGFYVWWFDEIWATLDGKTLKDAGYDRWLKGEPNNSGGKEWCGSMSSGENGLPELNDINCVNKNAFICEIPNLKDEDIPYLAQA